MRRLSWGIQIGLSGLLVCGGGTVLDGCSLHAAEYVNAFPMTNGGYPPPGTAPYANPYGGQELSYSNDGTPPNMGLPMAAYPQAVPPLAAYTQPVPAVGSQGPPPDAALVLASKALTPTTMSTPIPEEPAKKSFFDYFSKKSTTEPKPTATAEPKSTAKVAKEQPRAESPVHRPPTGASNTGSSNKFKSTKATGSQKPLFGNKKTKDTIDAGRAEIETLSQEKGYSEVDYIASATTPEGTVSGNLYNDGLLAESQGRQADAVRLYTSFIAANEQSTANGVLASPYHRLALISWKQGNVDNTDIYFRYAINYALSGNLLIIAGDYSQFLMAKGDYTKAETILRNALIGDPENKRLLFHLGRCVALQKKHQESLRYLVPAVGKDRAYQELAAIYRHQGDVALAEVAEQKRREFLASAPAPYPAPPAGYSMQPQTMQANVTPPHPSTSPYPPYGTMGQAVAATQQPQTPFPTLERPAVAYGAQAAPVNGGWQSAEPQRNKPSLTPQSNQAQPTAPETPVSKVYHYPSNAVSPVYYQYTGNQYPGTGQPIPSAPVAPTAPVPQADPWNSVSNASPSPVFPNNPPQPPQPGNVGWNMNQPLPY